MNRKPTELALVAVSLVCIMLLAACNCAPTLQYILITPTTSTISVGTTQQFTATGYYSNGSTTPGFSVTWASTSTAVATIDNTGVATGVAPGTTTITATALGITATPATLNVNQLLSIAITPATASVVAGGTQQYTATGTFKKPDGTTGTSDVTTLVTWSATPATVATIDNTTNIGLATGVAAGAATITASLNGITSNSATLTVGAAVATSLVVTPATANIAVGNATTFTVQEKWSDGTMHNPAGTVTWTSDTPADAWVVPTSATTASAAGFAAGTANISATEGALTTTTPAVLTVVTGTAQFAYVANANGTSSIGEYTVTATASPYLAPAGTVPTPSYSPSQTVLDPNGKYLYLIATASNTSVTVFKIDATTRAVTNAGFTPTVLDPSNPESTYGIVDPYGRFLYVVDLSDTAVATGAIYAFQISQTDGSLTAVTGSPFTTNVNGPVSIIADHSGQYLYVVNNGGNTVSSYQINQAWTAAGGALTPLATTPTIPTGTGPSFAATDPAGTHIYVPNNTDGTVSTFSIGAGGVLTNSGTTTVTGSISVLNLAVDPTDKYLYVLDGGDPTTLPTPTVGQLYGFTLTGGVPSATPITGTPIATGLAPTGIAIDPTSTLIAVDNSGDGVNPSTISLFTIGAGGALTSQTAVAAGVNPYFVTFYNAP
jgi:trimeric autotransporter adhesin